MKISPVWIYGVLLSLPFTVTALATVESRTGEPVIRHSEAVIQSEEPVIRSTSTVKASMADDRSGRLSLKQIDALQQEVSELRGLLETQDYEIQKLKKNQQDLSQELEKRLSEAKSVKPSKPPQPKAPAKAPEPKVTATPIAPVFEETHETAVEPVPDSQTETSATMPEQQSHSLSTGAINPVGASVAVQKTSGSNKMSEKELYSSAYHFVRTKQYNEAVSGFTEYLSKYPQGEQAANAHYWLGEVYMAKWQADKTNRGFLDQATQSFISLKAGFMEHPKVPDALLKLGLIEIEKSNFVAAREYLTEVKTHYPNSAAARIADARLQQVP